VEQAGTRPYIKLFATSDELAEALAAQPVSGAAILVKGSRGIRMEKVIPTL
jgi:UDP-N-acetylmuramyl pentapeptide synthase